MHHRTSQRAGSEGADGMPCVDLDTAGQALHRLLEMLASRLAARLLAERDDSAGPRSQSAGVCAVRGPGSRPA